MVEEKRLAGNTSAKFTTFDGVKPSAEENLGHIKQAMSEILSRKPFSVLIYAEFEDGIVAAAVGSHLTLTQLHRLGWRQVQDMLDRASTSGENG
jgi:hypothetical protein